MIEQTASHSNFLSLLVEIWFFVVHWFSFPVTIKIRRLSLPNDVAGEHEGILMSGEKPPPVFFVLPFPLGLNF